MSKIIKIICVLILMTSLSACGGDNIYIDDGPRVGEIKTFELNDDFYAATKLCEDYLSSIEIELFEDVVSYEFKFWEYLDGKWTVVDCFKRDKVDDEIEVAMQLIDNRLEIILKENDEIKVYKHELKADFDEIIYGAKHEDILIHNREVELYFVIDNQKDLQDFNVNDIPNSFKEAKCTKGAAISFVTSNK